MDPDTSASPRKKRKLPTEDRLTRAAVHYLDRYISSAHNLRQVLGRKVYLAARDHDRSADEFAEIIDAVVAKCLRSGMIDDKRYAEIKVASLRRRGRSTRQIAAALGAKGVAEDTIHQAMAGDNTTDLAAARRYAERRRLGPWRGIDKRAERRERDLAALCRAGFSYDVARKVMSMDPASQDDADDASD